VGGESLEECIRAVHSLETPDATAFKDYLRTWDLSQSQLLRVYYTARALQHLHARGASLRCFESGVAVSNFRDKSTRTKSAFAAAADMLGLSVMDFDESKSQVTHGETTRESAVMLSFLTEVMGIRDDLFLGFGHRYQLECADSLEESAQAGVLAQRPTVVNLQCDEDHPTQSMADLLHLADLFGSLQNLRGKKVAMTWAYSPSYGKPLSVPQGIIGLLPRFGIDVTLAHPPGYELLPEVCQLAAKHAQEQGCRFRVTHSMEEAFDGADVVYPKSWMPMQIAGQRSELYGKGVSSSDILGKLEKQCIAMNDAYMNWTCSEDLMRLTTRTAAGAAKPEAHYLHCLPADITGVSCKNGEVDASVFARHRLATYREASHKPFVIASAILLSRFNNASDLLGRLHSGPSRFR
jgi:knotted carbamoyltransferase YgeW